MGSQATSGLLALPVKRGPGLAHFGPVLCKSHYRMLIYPISFAPFAGAFQASTAKDGMFVTLYQPLALYDIVTIHRVKNVIRRFL